MSDKEAVTETTPTPKATEAVTEEKTTPTEAATEETTPAPATKETTPAPATEETTPAPATKETTPAPATEETTPAPATEETTPAPKAPEGKAESEGPLFAEDQGEGHPRYKTWDNDCCHGSQIPDLSSLEWLNESEHAAPKKGETMLIIFWAKYSKPGYKFFPMYSKLQNRYKGKLKVVGIATDPNRGDPEKFLKDPAGKYAKKFTTDYAVAFDAGKKMKEAFAAAIRDTLSLPHAFLVSDKGVIVWHQDHSELGATSPSYMALMEKQIDAQVTGAALVKVGDKEVESESESDSDGDGEAMGGMGDFFD